MNKRLMSMFLALCMVLTMLPVSAMAEEASTTIDTGGNIIGFAPLEKTEITVAVGTSIEEIGLPDTLVATVKTAVFNEEGLMPDLSVVNEEEPMPDSSIVSEEEPMPDSGIVSEDGLMPDMSMVNEEELVPDSSIVNEEEPMPDSSIVSEEEPVPDSSTLNEGELLQDLGEGNEEASPTITWEETNHVIPIEWKAEPEYDSESAGTYCFTPVIEGYLVSTDLPQIMVVVEEEMPMALMMEPMALSSSPVTTQAALQSAFNNVGEDGVILLGGNITLTSTITSPSDSRSFTLDLNGFTITGKSKSTAIRHKGTGILLIKDSVGTGKITISGSDSIAVLNASKGTIQINMANIITSGNRSHAIHNEDIGEIFVLGGTLSVDGAGAVAIDNLSDGTVVMTGGLVKSNGLASAAIYNEARGAVQIFGGEIIGTGELAEGVAMESGSLFISGGKTIIKGTERAVNLAPDLTNFPDVAVIASQTFEGTPKTDYDPALISKYKYLAFDQAYDAEIDGKKYVSLQTALNEATDGQTITILKNITSSSTFYKTGSESCVIDLKGKSITLSYGKAFWLGGSGTVTIKDSFIGGTIISDDYSEGTILNSGSGDFILDSGTIVKRITPQIGYTAAAIINSGTGNMTILNGNVYAEGTGAINSVGNVTIEGGTIRSNGNYVISTSESSKVTIMGGTISATGADTIALDHFGNGDVTISGGTISANGTALFILSSINTNISGGTITSENQHTIRNCYLGTVTVTGGEIIAKADGCSAIYNDANGRVVIEGGRITPSVNHTSTIDSGNRLLTNMMVSKGTANATGMNVHPISMADEPGYNTGVTVSGAAMSSNFERGIRSIARIGFTDYYTFESAIAAVDQGQTITVLQDVTLDSTIVIPNGHNKQFTLDLNGKTLSCSQTAIMHLGNESLTIKGDGKIVSGSDAIWMVRGADLYLENVTVDTTGSKAFAVRMFLGNLTVVNSSINASGGGGAAIRSDSDGNFTITDSILTTTGNGASSILNNKVGKVMLSGGTISTSGENSMAICNTGGGSITVSNATVSTSGDLSETIFNASTGSVSLLGCAVSAKGSQSNAIHNQDTSNINISGGMIESEHDVAIVSSLRNIVLSTGSLTIKGASGAVNKALTFASGARFDIWASTTNVTGADATIINGSLITADDSYASGYKYLNFVPKVVIVDENETGGGSGGSGESNSGGSSNNSSNPVIDATPASDKPNVPTQVEIKVSGTVDSKGNITANITDKAVIDSINKALEEAKNNGNEKKNIVVILHIDTGSNTGSQVTVNLPKAVQDTIITKKIESLIVVVDNPDITIEMDLEALKEIRKQSKADVSITATRKDRGKLTGDAKKTIGDRPVFDLKVNYGKNKQVQSFGSGSVSITIPYTLGKNENAGNVMAVYVDAKEKVHWLVNSVYDTMEQVLRFSTNHFSTYGIACKQINTAFKDITDHWAKEDIEFVVSRGLINSTSKTKFNPDKSLTRGMLVTALGRLAEADVSGYTKSSFTDVKSDADYMSYIEWANKNNILKGVEDNKFAPNQSITREQIAVIMLNYAKVIGFTVPKAHTENSFADSDKISDNAKDAVKQMQMAGVITGKKGNLFDPQGEITLAETSAMLRRFIEVMISRASMQGWMKNDAGQYFFYKDGSMVAEKWLEIDGKWYYFNADGSLAKSAK